MNTIIVMFAVKGAIDASLTVMMRMMTCSSLISHDIVEE
jgi:hypothetical protein